MAIQVTCPACGKVLRVSDSAAGKKGKCPGCGNAIQVPMVSQQDAFATPLGKVIEARSDVGSFQPTGGGASQCPHCGQSLDLASIPGGTQISCPVCGNDFTSGAPARPSIPPRPVPQRDEPILIEPLQEVPSKPKMVEARHSGSEPPPEEILPTAEWHVTTPDGRKIGPTDQKSIENAILQGGIPRGTKVWRKGMVAWGVIEMTEPFSRCFADVPPSLTEETPTTRPPGASVTSRIPKSMNWFIAAGSAALILCFFLPWIDLQLFTVAGYRIPNMAMQSSSGGAESLQAFVMLLIYLIPFTGAALIYTQFVSHPKRNIVALVSSIALLAVLLIMILPLGAHEHGGPSVFSFLSIGFYGTLLGGAGVLFGAIKERRQ